jgi:hypothetical protein
MERADLPRLIPKSGPVKIFPRPKLHVNQGGKNRSDERVSKISLLVHLLLKFRTEQFRSKNCFSCQGK